MYVLTQCDISQFNEGSVEGHLLIESPGEHIRNRPYDGPFSTQVLHIIPVFIYDDSGNKDPVVSWCPFIYIEPSLFLGIPSYPWKVSVTGNRSEEHTSELQSRGHLVCL